MSTIPNSLKRWLGLAPPEAPPAAPPSTGELRHSNGLREFFLHLKGQAALSILDLGPASQANINFITGLGHKIYHEDIYPELFSGAYRTRGDDGARSWDAAAFLQANLNYPQAHFDGVLGWDVLDLLPDPSALHSVVARLHFITKLRAALLIFFHTADPGSLVSVSRCQVRSHDALQMFVRGQNYLKRPLNNRNIERLFQDFHSLKFFLARDNLREVLVVR